MTYCRWVIRWLCVCAVCFFSLSFSGLPYSYIAHWLFIFTLHDCRMDCSFVRIPIFLSRISISARRMCNNNNHINRPAFVLCAWIRIVCQLEIIYEWLKQSDWMELKVLKKSKIICSNGSIVIYRKSWTKLRIILILNNSPTRARASKRIQHIFNVKY